MIVPINGPLILESVARIPFNNINNIDKKKTNKQDKRTERTYE